jgi:predicted dehydrogenase
MVKKRRVRIGFVGSGSIANERHLPWYAEIPEAEIAALCDVNEEALRATAAKYGVGESDCYTDYHEMVARPDLDAIEVCTPNQFHAAPTIAALEAGKPVCCQKPMASKIEDAEAMVAAAERAGQKLAIIYMNRFRPAMAHGAKAIKLGLLGTPTAIRARTAHAGGLGGMVKPGAWRHTFADSLAGSFSLLAVHYSDIFRWYMGPIIRIAAIGKTLVANMEGDDNMAAVLEFASGAVGSLESCYNQVPGGSRVEVYGDKGTLIIDRQFRLYTTVGDQASEEARQYLGSLGGGWGEQLARRADEMPPLSPFSNYTQHWVDCLLNDAYPVTDGREGMASLEVITAGYESSAKGAFVTLTHQ